MVADEGDGIFSGPLDRRARARTGRHADLWRRFDTAGRTSRWASLPGRDRAIATNLLELATLGEAADYQRLDRLLEQHGHEVVATVQNGTDELLGTGGDVPLLTRAIRRLSNRQPLEWRLVGAGIPRGEAELIACRCSTHVYWMLLADVDDVQPPLRPATPGDLRELLARGTARQWQALVAPMARNPWGPEGDRLVSLATAARLPRVVRALVECREIYRLLHEERERFAVAREIRRLVAVSGLSQREFASYVGTSPSRLSTYVTGKVTPSAAMLLRMRGAARMLQQDGRIA